MSVGMMWGPAFPDADSPTINVDAVPAILELTNVVEDPDSALTFAYLEARAGGAGGNAITVTFDDTALTESGEFEEDVGAKTILVKFVPGGTNVDQLFALLEGSVLVRLRGIWQTSDALRSTDAFLPTNMYGGTPARADHSAFWGPMIPDGPDGQLVIQPTAPGATSLVMSLEAGMRLELEWGSGMTKTRDGKEQRESTLSYPRMRISGVAYLPDAEEAVSARSRLQAIAATGAPVLVGMPNESLTAASFAGAVVTVRTRPDVFFGPAGPLVDWAVPGQTVAIFNPDGDLEEFVIQAVGPADTIELDREPSAAIAVEGAEVVPSVLAYLEPQQGFRRHAYSITEAGADAAGVEEWEVASHKAELGFVQPAVPARLALGTVTTGALVDAIVAAQQPGAGGNAFTLQFAAGAPVGAVDVFDDDQTVVLFEDGVSTVGDLEDALSASSTRLFLAGTFDRDAVLTQADDEFGPNPLTSGADEQPGTFGKGAPVTFWNGRPLWDRGLDVEDTVGDSAHAMTELLDLGGPPLSFGAAAAPDWGRQVAIHRQDPLEWQWLKAFLFSTKGSARTFYLPTYREDLRAVGDGPGGGPGAGVTGTIDIDASYGDFYAWWPSFAGSRLICVFQEDNARVVEVTDAVDLGNGSLQLTIRTDPSDPDGELPDAAPIDAISWVELCRWESSQFTVEWHGSQFAMDATARAVQR